MVDAYRVVHLNATATVMVKYFLDDFPREESRAAPGRRLPHQPRPGRARLSRSVLEKIDLLVNRADICPVTYFGIDKIEAFQTPVSAPYRMDLALTYRCNIDCSHCYNQRRESAELLDRRMEKDHAHALGHGIPHVDFTGGEPTLRDDLVELVTYAEDLGAHHRAADQRRAPGRRRISSRRLKEAGLDYVQVTLESRRGRCPQPHGRKRTRSP